MEHQRKNRFIVRVMTALFFLAFACVPARAADPHIVLASTTSTANSGLFGDILPKFKAETGIDVRVVAVGTGQALRIGQNGDADVVLVHDRAAEDAFVKAGWSAKRHDVMYNDFVIVGPASDPAKAAGKESVQGLSRIANSGLPFVSRGDNSGTHSKELALWTEANIDVKAASGMWYRATGSGMGATLNTAVAMNGYALTDRGTWLPFKNRGELKILVEGDPRLFNPYGVMLVNPQRHPHVRKTEGQAFIDWLIGPKGQAAIAGFKIEGQPGFFPSAAGS
jgi:tungstate transport system substrate-binding protein